MESLPRFRHSYIKWVALVVLIAALLGNDGFRLYFFSKAHYLATRLPGHKANADIARNIPELIESRGFKYEAHFITTSDGYILQTFRIVNPYVHDRSMLKPVLLFHGFQCSGSLWLVTSDGILEEDGIYYEYDEFNGLVNGSVAVGNTLGFVLASQGYDVWIANYRGSPYSTNHTYLDTEEKQFWSFSMDEMISIDIPAIIDHIMECSNQKHVAYIGHSQGNLLMFALLSKSDKYTQIVKPFIALSPVAFVKDLQTPSRHFQVVKPILKSIPGRFFHHDRFRTTYSQFCTVKYIENICVAFFTLFMGTDPQNIDKSRIGVYTANIPMGSGTGNAEHFFQLFQDGTPSHFDYGDPELNEAAYGTPVPPRYNMSNIKSTNIALIHLASDWFNPKWNVNLLKSELTVDLLDDYLVPNESLNHMELVWSKYAGKLVNTRVLQILNKKIR